MVMHVLQREAKVTALRETEQPANASYDFSAGVWRGENGLLAYDQRNNATTKKNDIETGEDQKGQ
jgi:hypothetical protein